MSEIYHIEMCQKDNTAWFNDSDSMSDYFHLTSGSLKYIIGSIQKYGGKSIEVHVTNNNPDVPAEARVKRIAKECGYSYKNTSHEHTWANNTTSYVIEYTLTKEKDVPQPPEPENIYLPDQVLEIGDTIVNGYGDTFKVLTVQKTYYDTQRITFSKLQKNGKVCKRIYSGAGRNYRKVA